MKFPNKIFSGYHGGCHCQGIAVDKVGGYVYYSFTTSLIKSDLDGNIVGSVDGLIGHLGCIDFCERDGKVYGSLEYKNDRIGKGILKTLNIETEIKNAFYCVIFDVDKIDRVGMNAESDGIMRAVYLPEVVEDFEGKVSHGGKALEHKYGCSGIDGTGWGPSFGKASDKELLYICYGIYGDVERCDNDYQVILAFDAEGWWENSARPLSQSNMHTVGERSHEKYFLNTGNTTWGVQNLEYDSYTGRFMLAVYRGKKECYPNYDMFFISSDCEPKKSVHSAYGEEITELSLLGEGIYFPYGSTGMCALGDGYCCFSEDGHDKERGFYTNAVLYRVTGDEADPFVRTE